MAVSEPHSVVDIPSLRAAERKYCQRLEEEPGDTGARLRLAWCLALQALYGAGQDSVVAALVAAGADLNARTRGRVLRLAVEVAVEEEGEEERWRKPDVMLSKSMRHATIVLQMSTHADEIADAQTLRALVTLSGGEQFVQEADDEAARAIMEITRGLLLDGDFPPGDGGRAAAPP